MKAIKNWLNKRPGIKRALEGFIKIAGLILIVGTIAYLLDSAGDVLNIL